MTFDEWKQLGLMPRAYNQWKKGTLEPADVIQSPDGTWLAKAGKLYLGRGSQDTITSAALYAKLASP